MSIMELLRNDMEIQKLKQEYMAASGKNPPPYNYDEYAGLEDYKQKLREEVAILKSK